MSTHGRLLAMLCGMALLSDAYGQFRPSHDFSVDFTHCSEFAGEGPVSLKVAQTLVPKGYTIAGASSGTANIVIRATSCEKITVNGEHPQQTNLSQIGINIVAPDGTGDINNYTYLYVTNNPYSASTEKLLNVLPPIS